MKEQSYLNSEFNNQRAKLAGNPTESLHLVERLNAILVMQIFSQDVGCEWEDSF